MEPVPLVEIEDVRAALGRPDVVLLDIRSSVDGGGRAAFEAGHVPGSVHSDYVADGWRIARGTAGGLLPAPDDLSRLLGRLGLGAGDHVVVVPAGTSAGDFAAAARVYWTLKVAGHRALSILNGGFAAWLAAGLPVEAGPGRSREPSDYPVRPDEAARATLPAVADALASRGATLVDSRSEGFFAGREKSGQVARAGRLSGAVLVDNARTFDGPTGRLKPLPELERLFAAVPDGPAIAYCNTGHVAATDWFILSELMGRPGVRLYDGRCPNGRAIRAGRSNRIRCAKGLAHSGRPCDTPAG